MIACLLFHPLAKTSIRRYQAGACKASSIGVGHHDEGLARIAANLEELAEDSSENKVCSDDAEGWDMSVSRDGFYLVIAALAHAATINGTKDEAFLFTHHLFAWAMIYTAQIIAVGGELIQINIFGLMASGIWPTGFLNSLTRSSDKMICGAKSAASGGDDNNCSYEPNLRDSGELGSGVRVKSVKDAEGNVVKENGVPLKARRISGPQGPHETTSFELSKKNGAWEYKFLGFNRLVARLFVKSNPETATSELPPGSDSTLSYRSILRQPANSSDLALLEEIYRRKGWDWCGSSTPGYFCSLVLWPS